MVQLLGYCAAALTTLAFVPQIVKTWRSHSAADLSWSMMAAFTSDVADLRRRTWLDANCRRQWYDAGFEPALDGSQTRTGGLAIHFGEGISVASLQAQARIALVGQPVASG